MNKLLDVKNLSIHFTQYTKGLHKRILPVIHHLDLDINRQEIMAVLGSSGSGKSLLAHAILGILPENSTVNGTIAYKGEQLTEEKKLLLRGKEIRFIPQSVTYLDPLMKIGKQVQLSISDKKEAQRLQEDIFSQYLLQPEVAELYPFELSGGMTRRVLIASAVIGDSTLIIADEPTPGLDKEALTEVLQCFTDLREKGKSILMITHDIEAAMDIADRIAIFYAGITIEIANKADFHGDGKQLRHPYTKALWRALPENGFHPIQGNQPSPLDGTTGCPFHPRCPFAKDLCREQLPEFQTAGNGKVRCHYYEEVQENNNDFKN
ncbi:ABC transporter ATP-binding protein [Cytobacillus praedii]|uniref:ABC transporter ATP-binding protein n=1 Tax=Cytobacillus praedii TaxID=1742358 RepID=UPI003AF68817